VPQQLDPVHFGHLQIRHDDIGRELCRDSESDDAVRRRLHRKPLLLEKTLEARPRARFVVHDENSSFGFLLGHGVHVPPASSVPIARPVETSMLAGALLKGSVMTPAKSILVATDFSDISERATAYAIDLAGQLGARVTFLHVYELPVYVFFDGALAVTSDLAGSLSAAADGAMATLVARQKASGVPAEGRVSVGSPADEVQRVAEEIKADLIVVGTHGRRGLARAFLGSVAEIVVRTSTRPVLVVPSPQAA